MIPNPYPTTNSRTGLHLAWHYYAKQSNPVRLGRASGQMIISMTAQQNFTVLDSAAPYKTIPIQYEGENQ